MNKIDMNMTIIQHDDLITADVSDAVMLMAVQKGFYFDMQRPASDIWKALETPKVVAELVDELVQVYDVSAEHCQKTVVAFLERLLEEGIAEVVPPEMLPQT